MRKVELLPTRDCEAGYGPAHFQNSLSLNELTPFFRNIYRLNLMAVMLSLNDPHFHQ